MRKNLTFIFIWCSLLMVAQTNLGSIKVNVEDGCGNVFTKPVTVDLYQTIGQNATKISSSATNPSIFNDLDAGYTYEVRISSSDVSDTEIGIKDIDVLRKTVLGFYPYTAPTNATGDFNNTGGLTTLDLVYMQRYMLKHPGIQYYKWRFFDQDSIAKNNYAPPTKIEISPNGTTEITFNGYKHGAVASTNPLFCGPCTIDTQSVANLLLPDLDLVAGKKVEFSVEYQSKPNDVGLLFSLNYKDSYIPVITAGEDTYFNVADSISSLYFFTYADNFGASSKLYKIATIQFTPNRSGKLTSFFTINQNFDNQFVYLEGNCYKNYQNLNIKTSGPCPVTWPLDAKIPDCNSNQDTGSPIIDPACFGIVTVSYKDVVVGTPCTSIIRTWTAVNWSTVEIFTHTQILTVDPFQSLGCFSDVTVLVQNGATIHVADFVKSPQSGHVYSFSPTDPNKIILQLQYVQPYIEFIPIYDLTDSTYCIIKVNKVNNCTEPIHVNNEISVKSQNGTYTIQSDLFDAGNTNHCRGFISDFEIKLPQSNEYKSEVMLNYDLYKGTKLQVDLRYKVNGIYETYGVATINFLLGNSLPPFELSCYDDPLTKNVPYEIAFFSSTFKDIYAIQGAIRVTDAIITSSKKVALADIKFNEELRALRFVWFNPSVTQVTLKGTDTLFSMTIMPTKSGTLSEILSIADDLLPSEALLNDFDQTKIDLVFKFLRRSSSTSDGNTALANVKIYPNPYNSGPLYIQTNGMQQANLSLYNERGQLVFEEKVVNSENEFQVTLPEHLSSGLYIVRLANDRETTMSKIMIIR